MKNSTVTLSIILGVSFIILCLAGCPQYLVYSSKMQGQAQLAHAQASKEVQVAEAKAKMESASYEAMADTIRAHGVARSNEIIGQSLNENKNYLYWLWISEINKKDNVIYVSTGIDNMPIMEATRFSEIKNKKDSLEADKK